MTFKWPYEGNNVIVMGTFGKWTKKYELQKNGNEFSTNIVKTRKNIL